MTDATLTVIVTIVRIVIAVVFIGMGINHFVPKSARVMAKMIPPALRREGALNPLNLVYLTGVCEIAAASSARFRAASCSTTEEGGEVIESYSCAYRFNPDR